MSKLKAWKRIRESVIERRGPFTLVSSILENPRNGAVLDLLRVDFMNIVTVIPITPEGQVVMVRQYRSGLDDICLELPGGCAAEGETSMSGAASRELLEETGYMTTVPLEHLGVVHPNPALMRGTCDIFVARNVKPVSGQELDEGEDIELVLFPLSDIPQMILDRVISHSLIISVFSIFFLKYPEHLS